MTQEHNPSYVALQLIHSKARLDEVLDLLATPRPVTVRTEMQKKALLLEQLALLEEIPYLAGELDG